MLEYEKGSGAQYMPIKIQNSSLWLCLHNQHAISVRLF